MTQVTIDEEFKTNLTNVKAMVLEFLSKCYSCRNDDEHLRNHIHVFYPNANSESIRRMRQKIQNTEGLYPADKETQLARAAKQQFMEKNVGKI
jgi:hypothetical protein